MMRKGMHYLAIWLVLVFVQNAGPALAAELEPVGELEALIQEALLHNPNLGAAVENEQVFEQRPSQAEALDNPRIGLGLLNLPVDTFSFDQEAMTQKQISLMQRFPFPGKLELKGNMARKDLDAARDETAEIRNSLVRQVTTAYWNLLFLGTAITKTEENRDLLKNFTKIAETKYSVGQGLQQDVLKAQVELSRMIDRLLTLKQQRRSLTARLDMLLGRPEGQPLTLKKTLENVAPPGVSLTLEELRDTAFANRPALGSLRKRIDKAELARRLAEKNYYPDIDVGLNYGQRDDGNGLDRPDFLSATVSFTVPLWYKSKERKKVAEAEADIRKAKVQYQAMQDEITFGIRDRLAAIERYRDEIDLFKTGLIPQSRTSLESAMSGYQVNKVDFITLVNNQTTLYNYEIEYYRVLTEYENQLAELEATVGKRLFRADTL